MLFIHGFSYGFLATISMVFIIAVVVKCMFILDDYEKQGKQLKELEENDEKQQQQQQESEIIVLDTLEKLYTFHNKRIQRNEFDKVVGLRLYAFHNALDIRKNCLDKLNNKIDMSLEEIFTARKIIKKMDHKMRKYQKKMNHYPFLRQLFIIPELPQEKNDYKSYTFSKTTENAVNDEKGIDIIKGIQS